MMNWILLVMGAVAAVVVAMIVGGLLSPRIRTATRTLTCEATPDAVYHLLREADGPPRWCPALPTMDVQVADAPRHLRLALRDDDGAPLGTWDITVHGHEAHTVVTLTETVAVNNPVLRFLRSFGGTGERPQRFLEAVARELGCPPRIGVVDSPV